MLLSLGKLAADYIRFFLVSKYSKWNVDGGVPLSSDMSFDIDLLRHLYGRVSRLWLLESRGHILFNLELSVLLTVLAL